MWSLEVIVEKNDEKNDLARERIHAIRTAKTLPRRLEFLNWVTSGYGIILSEACADQIPLGCNNFNEDEVLGKAKAYCWRTENQIAKGCCNDC